MKKIAGLFLMALLSGAITLGAYKLFFESNNNEYDAQDKGTPFITASTNALTNYSGINEIDFTNAAEKTVNSVVHVKNRTLGSNAPSLFDFFYGFESQQRPQIGTGSGVIISPDGYIVTNNHVIARSSELEVTLNNNRTYKAEIVGADKASDIALLKIEAEDDLPFLAFGDSDNTRIGEWVLAVGNPFNLTSTVTAGIVSAKARSLNGNSQSFIQTDAAVNPGNSGGALVNTNGDLIGINTAITSQTGSYVGYSFAVPSNIAKKVVDDLLEFGNVQKGILGVSTVPSNTPIAEEMGIANIEGVYVNTVEEDSGAEAAGIKEGDIIKKVDRVTITKFSELTGYLSSKRPKDVVEVTVERDGELVILPVTLKKNESAQLPVMGFVVKNLNAKDEKKFKRKEGVKITNVPERFSRYDLVGKVIIEVDEERITDLDDATDAFSKISQYGNTSITLIDENGERERLIFR